STYGSAVGLVVRGAEQLLGEDGEQQASVDSASVRIGELRSITGEHGDGLADHRKVPGAIRIFVRITGDPINRSHDPAHQEGRHIELLPGRQILTEEDGKPGVESPRL